MRRLNRLQSLTRGRGLRGQIASICSALALMLLFTLPTHAQNRSLNLVRDAEIEHILALYAKPLFQAANLDPRVARTYLVNDPSLNAFVAGGQRIFVFTGLILKTELPRQLVGVLAHETGHIRGGHLSRTAEALAQQTALPQPVCQILARAGVDANAAQAYLSPTLRDLMPEIKRRASIKNFHAVTKSSELSG